MPFNHLILCPTFLLLPSIFLSIRVFSNELALLISWPNYWSFSFSISPSKEYSGLISFRIDWFDLLAVQGTLKSLLQHHSSKVSVVWCSAFFTVQLSHPYMTTGKTIALTRWTFVGKVMPAFNVLSRCLDILLLLLSHFSRVRLCATPIDGSPPGFPVPGILQARTLEWVAMSFSNACKGKVKVKALSRVRCILIFSLTKEIILSIIMLNVNCFDTIYK